MIGVIVVIVWFALIFTPVDSGPPPYDTCVCPYEKPIAEKGK